MLLYTISNTSGKEFCKIHYKSENDIIYSEWIGFISDSESAKEACLKMSEAIQKHKVKCLLNDNREQTGPWPPIADWLNTVWIPSMSKAGLKFFAHIFSTNVFTKLSAGKVLTEEKEGIIFNNFDNEKEALDWLVLQRYLL